MSLKEAGSWAPDLATRAGRQAFEARVARAQAILIDAGELSARSPDALPPDHPYLVVGTAPADSGAVVTLDHVVRRSADDRTVLRRRLALVRVEDVENPAFEDAIFVWSVLAREYAELARERLDKMARAQRLVCELRP